MSYAEELKIIVMTPRKEKSVPPIILSVSFSLKKSAAKKTEITGYIEEMGATLAEPASLIASKKV